ncbi:MFS transporter [Nocardioides taihuensis]|uniref:MFS transporter n=1 Tax=Nocardioides taihuensis TaxID=1835606 RepID=A0ABW0BKR0_9ACTN
MSAPAVRRHLASYALASVALSLPWPLLLLLTWERYGDAPHGALVVGAVGAARMVPYVLLSWLVGSLGDRVRRERLLAATLVLRLACLAVVALGVASGHLLAAVVAAALAIACGTPAYPAVAAAMPQLAGAGSRRATEALVTTEVAAWVVGPALGGLMLTPWGRPWAPTLAVALTLLAIAAAWGVPLPGPATDRRTREAVTGMVRTVRTTPVVVAALACGGLVNVVVTATAVLLLPLTQHAWGQSASGFGVATACLGFGALGAPLLWWVRGPAGSRGRWGLALLGALLAWVALSPLPAAALPVLAVVGALAVMVECAVTETLQAEVPDEHRAGVLGVADTVMVAGAMVGSFVAPLLAARLGSRGALLVAGAGCLVVLLPVVLRSVARRRVELADETSSHPRQARPTLERV